MIIALLVIMFIILVVLYNVIDKIISVEKKIGELEANVEAEKLYIRMDTEFNADAISQLGIDGEKIFKALRLMNDMDITLLDKINDLDKTVGELEDDVWVLQILGDSAGKQINELEEKIEELELIIGATNIKADKIKTGTIPKTCSIDGKCN